MLEISSHTWVQIAAYGGGGICMGFGAIGAAVGEGYAASQAVFALSRNTDLSGDVLKSMLVGQAIAESASIFALVIAMILLFTNFSGIEAPITALALLGAGLAMGFGALGSGIGSGLPAASCCTGIVRQPGAKGKLTTNMLIGSAVCQTPSIFALVVAFILIFTDYTQHATAPTWAALLGAGLSSGFGAIGSGIGGGAVGQTSCEGIARQPSSASTVTNVMLLGQAVAQTPAILSLLVSFILIFKEYPASDSLGSAMALLGAGLCMGVGAIGPGIGEGIAASSGTKWVARNEAATNIIIRTMLVGMAVAESTAIYAMVISLCLIFVF
jgi:F-type H+-transporting ATPase subunit c